MNRRSIKQSRKIIYLVEQGRHRVTVDDTDTSPDSKIWENRVSLRLGAVQHRAEQRGLGPQRHRAIHQH